MHFIQGEDRRQEQLLPARVEEYVAAGSPVRVIDAFVEQLELEQLGFEVAPKETGRPRYHPAVLLKLFIYGYLQRIRSSCWPVWFGLKRMLRRARATPGMMLVAVFGTSIMVTSRFDGWNSG